MNMMHTESHLYSPFRVSKIGSIFKVCLLLGLVALGSAWADDPQIMLIGYAQTDEGPTGLYYDPSTLTTWEGHASANIIGSSKIQSVIALATADCATGSLRLSNAYTYNPEGQLIGKTNQGENIEIQASQDPLVTKAVAIFCKNPAPVYSQDFTISRPTRANNKTAIGGGLLQAFGMTLGWLGSAYAQYINSPAALPRATPYYPPLQPIQIKSVRGY